MSIFFDAIKNNDTREIARQIREYKTCGILDDWSDDGISIDDTPLTHAIEFDRLNVVQTLACAGADINKGNRGTNQTPMHIAARCGRTHIIEFLLDMNAEVNPKDSKGSTPLDLAIGNNHIENDAKLVLRSAGGRRGVSLCPEQPEKDCCEHTDMVRRRGHRYLAGIRPIKIIRLKTHLNDCHADMEDLAAYCGRLVVVRTDLSIFRDWESIIRYVDFLEAVRIMTKEYDFKTTEAEYQLTHAMDRSRKGWGDKP